MERPWTSRASRSCGLKSALIAEDQPTMTVTSFTLVWIKIVWSANPLSPVRVTSFTLVWIKMTKIKISL